MCSWILNQTMRSNGSLLGHDNQLESNGHSADNLTVSKNKKRIKIIKKIKKIKKG